MNALTVSTAISSGRVHLVSIRQASLDTARLRVLWVAVIFAVVAAIAVLTPGYQLFQAANNTAVMAGVPVARRGRVSAEVTSTSSIRPSAKARAHQSRASSGRTRAQKEASSPEVAKPSRVRAAVQAQSITASSSGAGQSCRSGRTRSVRS